MGSVRRRWLVVAVATAVAVIGADLAAAEPATPEVESPENTEAAADAKPVSEPRDLAGELGVDGEMPGAGGRDTGDVDAGERVRELESMRSEGAQTWALDSGLKETEFFAEPQWFRGPGGEWVDVDPHVVADGRTGEVRAAGVGYVARFGTAAAGVLVEFEGRRVRLLPRGRGDVAPQLDEGDKAVVWYRGLLSGVDLRYTVTATGLKEDFVVHSLDALEEAGGFTVDVESEGALIADPERPQSLVIDWNGDGRSAWQGDADGPKMRIPEPSVTDAKGRPVTELKPALSADLAGERGQAGRRRARPLGLTLDREAAARLSADRFPLVVDPTFEIIPASMGGTWASYNQAGNLTTSTNQWGLLGDWRIFGTTDYWRFIIKPGLPWLWTQLAPNPQVFSAQLKLTAAGYPQAVAPTFNTSWASFPTSTTPALVNACYANGWNYAGAYPGMDVNQCSSSYYFGYTLTDSLLGGGGSSTMVDVSDMIRPWVAAKNTAPAIGVSVATDTPAYNFKSTAPSLLVTWDQQTPVTTPVQPADGATLTSTTPTLEVNAVTDPDSGQNPPLYRAMVFAGKPPASASATPQQQCGADTALWSSSWVQNQTSFTVPDGVLADGVSYWWTIATTGNVFPGYATCSGPWKFTVDRRLGASGVFPTQELGPVTVNMATGNVVTSIGAHSVSTVGGEIAPTFTYNSQARSNHGLRASFYGGDHPATKQPLPDANALFDEQSFHQRVDQKIDVDWSIQGPMDGGGELDNFAARWTGYVTVPQAGSYCFGTRADDGSRVYINGVLVMNSWATQTVADKQCTTSVSFAAGETKHIRVEYFDKNSVASIQLKVYGGPTGTMVVPTGWLSTEPNVLGPGWTFSDGDVSIAGARSSGAGVTVTMGDGSSVQYTKSTSGAFVGPDGDATAVSVDPANRQISVTDDAGTSYTYSAEGELLSAVAAADDRSPAATQMVWSGTPARLTAMRDPVSNQDVTLRYGGDSACSAPPSGFAIAAGQLCRVESWDGAATDLFYDSDRRLSRVVQPGGARTDFTYDSGNRITSITDAAANDAVAAGVRASDASVTWQIAYTGDKATTITAPAPAAGAARQASTISYDSQPSGSTLGETRLNVGGLAAPLGFTEKSRFDTSMREREVIDASGSVTRITYDGTTDRVSYTDTDADTAHALRTSTIYDTSVVFNGLSRPIREHGPAPVASFSGAAPTVAVPTTETNYDEGINGLAAAWWNDAADGVANPNRPTFVGAPVLHTLLTGTANWSWGTTSPDTALLGSNNFSVRLTGLVHLPSAGNWRFAGQADDNVRVTVDDHLAVDTWSTPLAKGTSPLINLAAGWHRISVDMREHSASASLKLWYTPPGGTETFIPSTALKPDLGLATSSVQEDGKTTSTTYADPILGLETASTLDPTGVNLSTATTYETPGTGSYLRRTARALPAAAASGLQPITYTHYGPTEVAPTVACAGTGVTVPSVSQRGLSKTSRMADPNTHGGTGGIVRQQVHDAAGRVVATRVSTDPEWSCTQLDSRGRPTAQTYPSLGSEAERTVTTNYSVGGDPFLTSVTDDSLPSGSDTIRTRVDLLGRVTDYRDVWGTHTHVDYDLAGRVTQTTVFRMSGTTGNIVEAVMSDYASTGPAVNQLAATRWTNAVAPVSGYNATTLTTTTAMPTAAGTTLAAITYDTAGRLSYVDYANGVRSTTTYDTYGREAGIAHTKGATTLSSETITRDLPGRVVDRVVDGIDANPAGANYVYDGASRLTEWWETDPSTSTQHHGTYTFGTAPTECASGGWGNATNAGRNSNRATSTVQVNGGAVATTKYCYDFADRIRSVITPAGTANPYAGGFTYDAHGNITQMGGEVRGYDGADRHLSTGPAGTLNALLVVGAPGSLTSRDTWLRDRLQAAGWTVATVDDNGITAATASGKGVVVIADSVDPAQVGTAFTAVAVPVVSAEPLLSDELAMTGTGTNQGVTNADQASIDITTAGQTHNLGGGFAAGPMATASTAAMTHGWGKPASGAVVAATVTGDSTKAAVYGYETGAAMQTGTAPARRVGFFLADGNASVLTDNAVALFDAAVSWAANTAPKVAYRRDATDRIVERSANGRVVARYSYTASGDTSDVTLDQNGQVLEATISLPGGAIYTWRSAQPVWSYPNTHGDITVIADTSGNKVGPTRAYDPFGRPLTGAAEVDNSAGELDYAWLGEHQRPLEHQTGLIPIIEMGARQYDPFLGRFLEVDPIEGGGANDYAYPFDPLNMTDLDGNCWGPASRLPGCGTLRNAGKAVGRQTRRAYRWTMRNRGALATGGAFFACLGSSGLLCGGAMALAYGVRAQQRIQRQGFRRSLGANIADGVLSYGTFGLIRLPGKFIQPWAARQGGSVRSLSRWQKGFSAFSGGSVGGSNFVGCQIGRRRGRRGYC